MKSFAAVLSISPVPRSVADSTAVLQRLTSFGQVNYFMKSSGHPQPSKTFHNRIHEVQTGQRYDVHFASFRDLSQAIAASPFTVDVDQDATKEAEQLDPFNIYGLQSRWKPSAASFSCSLVEDEEQQIQTSGNGQKVYGPVTKLGTPRDERLERELLEAQMPSGLLKGITKTIRNSKVATTANTEWNRTVIVPLPPNLMAMYRESTARAKERGRPGPKPSDPSLSSR